LSYIPWIAALMTTPHRCKQVGASETLMRWWA